MVTSRVRLGDFGERVAAYRLESEGMEIVARKVRTASGEIDIVAQDGDETVCIEVRTRRSAPGAASESIIRPKLARMWRCAFDYCETNAIDAATIRVDLITVELDATGLVTTYFHYCGLDLPEG